MRRSRFIVGLLVAGVAVAIPTAASAKQTQTVKGKITPAKLPKKKRKPVALRVITTTSDPQAPGQVPSPATRALVHFDDAGKPYPGVAATCTTGQIAGKATAEAKAECPNAVVGGGKATVFVPAGLTHITYNAEVTAFNAAKVGGRPAIILYSYVEDLTYGQPLLGVFKVSKAGKDFGVALDVSIPPLPFDAALTLFDVTTGNGFKRGYIKANCSDRNKRLNVKAKFTYSNGTSLSAVSKPQKCKTTGGR
jgi:hypothetical protein